MYFHYNFQNIIFKIMNLLFITNKYCIHSFAYYLPEQSQDKTNTHIQIYLTKMKIIIET